MAQQPPYDPQAGQVPHSPPSPQQPGAWPQGNSLMYPHAGYSPPQKRRVAWWKHLLALALPPPVALILGLPLWFLGVFATVGDIPPANADRLLAWFAASYLAVAVLFGLGTHAIVTRDARALIVGVVVTVLIILVTIVQYGSTFQSHTAP